MGYSSGEPPLLSLLGDENSHSRRHRSMLFSVDNSSSSARLHIFGRDHHIVYRAQPATPPSNQSTGGALRRALNDPWWYMILRVVCWHSWLLFCARAASSEGWWQRCRFVSRTFFDRCSCQLEGKKIRDLKNVREKKSVSGAAQPLRRTNYEETDKL